jgi:hypothetical protein
MLLLVDVLLFDQYAEQTLTFVKLLSGHASVTLKVPASHNV